MFSNFIDEKQIFLLVNQTSTNIKWNWNVSYGIHLIESITLSVPEDLGYIAIDRCFDYLDNMLTNLLCVARTFVSYKVSKLLYAPRLFQVAWRDNCHQEEGCADCSIDPLCEI